MAVPYRTTKVILGFLDGKPEAWKQQKLCFPVITEKALIEYIANSAAIPKTTVKGCLLAISEAITYFVINGHQVTFNSFGSFYLKVKTKVAQSLEECTAKNVTHTTIGFTANSALAELVNNAKVQKVEAMDIN